MESLYTSGPVSVPPAFTEPTKSFKKRVVLALIVLVLFILTYLILMFLFGFESYRMLRAAFQTGEGGFLPIIGGIMLGVLCLFMFKSLFIFKKRDYTGLNEISKEDQPVLFDFLYKLADEAGAPRPHKVFLTMNVNASVFYDLSFFNLLWPSKKNLNIGMGLINVLNIGELKAVLAHEFGHFAQRSMLLGRYVYVAQQIMVKVVYQRDFFDKILSGISSIDIRIAWIGWILSILVWAIRSLIETLFTVVNILEKALSREMEFQADLVAVSMTGSDALIHALHKLRAADEGFHGAIDSANSILSKGKKVEDIYALQSNYIEKMRLVLDDSEYGKSPEIVSKDGKFRVFKDRDIAPPEMWSTHPADNLREENAKRSYIYSEIDDRSSWLLMHDSDNLRRNLTNALYEGATEKPENASIEENIEQMNKEQFNWSFFKAEYHGNFFSRYGFRNFIDVDELLSFNLGSNFKSEYEYTYPNSLKNTISRWTEMQEEKHKLTLATNESVTIEKRQFMYRGEPIKRSDIPEILNSLKTEEQELLEELKRHDSRCRTLAYQIAKKNDPALAEYIKQLNELILYSEHKLLNLADMQKKYGNVLSVVLADGRVSSSEMKEVLSVSSDLYKLIRIAFLDSEKIEVGESLELKLEKPYKDMFEEFKFSNSTESNISNWVENVGGWYEQATGNLTKLRNAALEHLLVIEENIKASVVDGKPLKSKAEKISFTSKYARFLPGSERELQLKLGFWDRFHTMDGLWPTIAKFAASILLVGGALALGNYEAQRDLIIYNGLGTSVKVIIENEDYELNPHSKKEIQIESEDFSHVLTLSEEGDTIEYVKSDYDPYAGNNIYNVAKAAGFMSYKVYYGYEGSDYTKYLNNPQWISSSANYCLTNVPEQISTSSTSGTSRTVLEAVSNISPFALITIVEDEDQKEEMINAHAIWDDSKAENLLGWLTLCQGTKNGDQVIKKRLEKKPNELITMRLLMDSYDESEKDELCERIRTDFQTDPTNGDLYYLQTRCLEDGPEQNNLFVEGAKKWPEHSWMNYASSSIYANRNDWESSLECASIVIEQDKGLTSSLGTIFDRIRRISEVKGLDVSFVKSNLQKNSQVEFFNGLENGLIEFQYTEYDKAMYQMSQGLGEIALETIEGKTDESIVKLYVGASDQASQKEISSALSISLDSINGDDLFVMLGLKIRESMDINSLVQKIQTQYEDRSQVLKALPVLIRACRKGYISESDKDILFVDSFTEKNILYLMARIAVRGKTPKIWRERVEHMLYGFEKPYFE